MTSNDLCPTCNKPLSSGIGGFVTRMVDVCHCRSSDFEQVQTIRICATCGGRIATSKGTFTQWIFGEGRCECERPEAVETPVDNFVMPSFVGFHKEDDETELEVEAEGFPLDRYKPIGRLGRGAAGQVFLCRDRILGKRVAVKTLINLDAEQLVAFQDEARATARLDHKGIVRVLDFGATDGGTPYMVMDYIPGVNLERFIETQGVMSEETARHVFSRLANALQYSHDQGIFHRDIKPNNILLFESEDGIDASIIDFGVAKVKESTGLVTAYQNKTLAGTPNYMSPDPVRGESYDARSEVYSLGCVLFEALTGEPPFVAESALETLALHANEKPVSVQDYSDELSDSISSIVSTCLEKEKSYRYDSMAELATNLDSHDYRLFETEQGQESESYAELAKQSLRTKSDNRKIFFSFGVLTLGVLAVVWILLIRNTGFEAEGEALLNFRTPSEDRKPVILNESRSMNVQIAKGFVQSDRSGRSIRIESMTVGKNQIVQMNQISKEKNLEDLSVLYCRFDSEFLKNLARIDTLKNLRLIESIYDEADLVALSKSKSLRSIFLTGDFSAKSFNYLAGISNLTSVTIRNYSSEEVVLKASDLAAFSKLQYLRQISIQGMSLEPDALRELAKMKELAKLNLKAEIITNGQLSAFPEFEKLQSLSIQGAKIESSDFFAVMAKLPWLYDISLHSCILADQSRKSLTSIGELSKVNLNDCRSNILTDARGLRFREVRILEREGESSKVNLFRKRNKLRGGKTILMIM